MTCVTFDIVNFPFLDGDVPRSASYGVYISQLIRFAQVSSHVDDLHELHDGRSDFRLNDGTILNRT